VVPASSANQGIIQKFLVLRSAPLAQLGRSQMKALLSIVQAVLQDASCGGVKINAHPVGLESSRQLSG